MSTSIGPNYDPASTAAALAESYTAGTQGILTARTRRADATGAALTQLRSAISAYQASLGALTAGKTMLSYAATLSDASFGSARAGTGATPGSYSLYVERLATASQVAYRGLADSAAAGGTLGIELGGAAAFTVDLAAADANADGTLTPREMAAAINGAGANGARVSASLVTIGGNTQMILTAKASGAASTITLDTSAVADPALKAALADPDNASTVTAGQDALVWLGAQGSGTPIAQASNTFTNIDGVALTFTKAQAPGAPPLTFTVAADHGASSANVQGFVDSYNKLKVMIDAMVAPADPAKGTAGGAFADDAGIKALQSRLVSLLRPGAAGADSLAAYGLIGARNGTLTLDTARLTRQLALNPGGLDQLIGSAAAGSASGIAGALDSYLKQWSSGTDGQLKQRQEANQKLQATLGRRQDQLDRQYDSAYKRYRDQFTQLQNLQSRMASNTSMFDALFGAKSD